MTAEAYRTAFDRFDTDRSGTIDARELRRALDAMGVKHAGASGIIDRYDVHDARAPTLDLAEFTNLVKEVVAAQMESAALEQLTAARLSATFNQLDADKSGSLDVGELRKALDLLGVHVDLAGARDVMAKYEGGARQQARGLNIGEFTTLVRDVVAFQEQQTAATLTTVERCAVAFNRFDTDRSGFIEGRELSRALDAMGVPGDTDHVRAAIAKYGEALGNRAQGRINAEEFAKLTRDLVAAQQTERALAALAPESYKQAFDRFDTDKSGTIDAAELARALDSMGVKHAGASAILQRYDQHDAPSLDLTEYSDLVRDLISYQQRQLLPQAGAERVRQMFAHHDASKLAAIDMKELRPTLEKLGLKVDAEDVRTLIARYDVGGAPLRKSNAELLDGLAELMRKHPVLRLEVRSEAALADEPATSLPMDRVRAAFATYDVDNSGTIDLRELRPALDQMGVKNVDDKAVSDWMTRYDSSRGVRLELAEFVRLVQDVIAKQHADSTMDFFFSEKLKGAFQYVDVNRSGTIDVKELQRALDVMGVHVDLAQAKGVMARYDVDRNSSLDLAEFARLVADIIAWKQRESLEKEVSPEKIRAAFKLFDHNNDNFIDVRELKPALDRLQPAFEKTGASAKTKAAQLLAQYDASKDKKLDVAEFTRLVQDLMRSQLREIAMGHFFSDKVKAAFSQFDTNKSGRIEAKELQPALDLLGIHVDQAANQDIMARYRTKKEGMLNFDDFGKLVRDLVAWQQRQQAAASIPRAQIEGAFNQFDVDRSGRIDASELRRALERLGVKVDAAQAREVLAKYDKPRGGGSGGLDLAAFTRLVRDLVTWQQQQAVNAPQLTERINRAFQQYDRNRNGKISGAELRPALEGLGVPADRAGVKEALARFGTPGKELDLAEFGRLVKEALAAKGVEEAIAAATPERLRQIFSRFDKDGSGTIVAQEMQPALAAMGMQVNLAEAKSVMAKYDQKGLDLAEFTTLVHDLVAAQQAEAALAALTADRLRATFTQLDADKSGSLDVGELRKALDLLGLRDINLAGAREVMAKYGGGGAARKSGLDVADFTRLVQDLLAWRQTQAVMATVTQERLQAAFNQFDTDRSGTIEVRELRPALDLLGLHVSMDEARAKIAQYNAKRDPKLDLAGFAALVHDVVCDQATAAANGRGESEVGRRRLAAFFGSGKDQASLCDALARARVKSTIDALAQRGVPESRLDFAAELPGRAKYSIVTLTPRVLDDVYDPQSGLLPASVPFTVRRGATEVEVLLRRAAARVDVVLRSAHPDRNHWSNQLQLPESLTVAARHLHQHVVIGRKATTVPRVALADPDLFASEEYVFTLERSRYTDKCEITTRLAPGLNEIELPLEWQARLVSLSFVSVANYVVDAAEVHRRIKDFMQSNDVVFDGAGDTELAHLPQAWDIKHSDANRRKRNMDTLAGIASILKEYPGIRCTVHGETGARARGAAAARRLPGPPPDARRPAVHGLAGGGARALVQPRARGARRREGAVGRHLPRPRRPPGGRLHPAPRRRRRRHAGAERQGAAAPRRHPVRAAAQGERRAHPPRRRTTSPPSR